MPETEVMLRMISEPTEGRRRKPNIVWDTTLMDSYQNCKAYFKMAYRLNKRAPKKTKALDQGSIFHYGAEEYYKGLKNQLSFETCVENGRKAMQIALTISDLDTNQGERCLDVFEEYCNRWRIEDKGWEIVAVEAPFSYELHEDDTLRITMIGKIDLLWSNHQYEYLPVDHKTYERDSELSRLTNQFTNYAYATDSNFLMVNRVGFQTSVKPEVKHKRVMLSYDPIFKEQWKQNVIKWAYEYYDSLADDNWPMNPTSCFKYNRPCIYKHICETTGDENKEYKLNVDFETGEPWDVSKALTRKG